MVSSMPFRRQRYPMHFLRDGTVRVERVRADRARKIRQAGIAERELERRATQKQRLT